MNTTNQQTWLDEYTKRLRAEMEANPHDFYILPKAIDSGDPARYTAEIMTLALASGNANTSPTIKATARALGIKPTQRAIREYLNA